MLWNVSVFCVLGSTFRKLVSCCGSPDQCADYCSTPPPSRETQNAVECQMCVPGNTVRTLVMCCGFPDQCSRLDPPFPLPQHWFKPQSSMINSAGRSAAVSEVVCLGGTVGGHGGLRVCRFVSLTAHMSQVRTPLPPLLAPGRIDAVNPYPLMRLGLSGQHNYLCREMWTAWPGKHTEIASTAADT